MDATKPIAGTFRRVVVESGAIWNIGVSLSDSSASQTGVAFESWSNVETSRATSARVRVVQGNVRTGDVVHKNRDEFDVARLSRVCMAATDGAAVVHVHLRG